MRQFPWKSVRALGVVCVVAACADGQAADSADARSKIIATGVVSVSPAGSNEANTLFHVQLSRGGTQVVQGTRPCDGAIGSVLPPMGFSGCVSAALMLPFAVGSRWLEAAIGPDPNEQHVYLSGIERFWTHQSRRNDCWAEALDITRQYLGLAAVGQDGIVNLALRGCPALLNQPGGADAYQVTFTSAVLNVLFDHGKPWAPHFCQDFKCIVADLVGHHPVLLMGKEHVVLIVGARYHFYPQTPDVVMIRNFDILDPAGDPSAGTVVLEISALDACSGDVFLTI